MSLENSMFLIGGAGLLLIYASFMLALFLIRKRLKVVDKLVLGSELPRGIDNVFYSIMRLTNYSGGFCCKWCARRSKIYEKIASLDKQFRVPFQIYFILLSSGVLLMVFAIVMQNSHAH